MGRNLFKLTKNFETSSSCSFYDIIKMRHLKNRTFSKVIAEYLRNGSIDFHQTYVGFRQSYNKLFEITRLDIGHS